MQDLLAGHFGLESLLRCFGVVRLLRVIQNPAFAAGGPAAWKHCTTPSPQPYPWGCFRMPAMAGARPGHARPKKKLAQAASGFLQ